jgi:hypothetical protein
VKIKAIGQPEFSKSVPGATVAGLCGLRLWKTPTGGLWVNASCDCFFRFGTRTHPGSAPGFEF